MMDLHKPPAFNLAQAVPHTHRRRLSAPSAVVVQPTKTPGLLSISKPARMTPQRQMPSQQRHQLQSLSRSKPQPQQKSLVARAPALLNPAEITSKKPALAALQAPVSPTPQYRGRGGKHARERSQQIKRTSSPSPVRGKHSRQPSPPVDTNLQQPLQAEDQITKLNHFDPFLDHPEPLKTPHKQQPPLSESIPVPKLARPKTHSAMARSEPDVSYMSARPTRARAHNFPVCDDSTDGGDVSDLDSPGVITPPATPVRKQVFANKTDLVNAPVSAKASAGFPFNYSPPFSHKGRKHRRSPSEGVFNMSSDEDVSTGPGGIVFNQNLFGLVRNANPSAKGFTTPPPSLGRAGGAAFVQQLDGSPMMGGPKPAGYFASSLFQNSPSPDELPDPLLF